MRIKEQLQAIRNLDFEIDSLLRVMEVERARAERRTTVFSLEEKGSGDAHSREHTYVKLIDLSRQIDEKIGELVDTRNALMAIVLELESSDERSVIISRYFNRHTWEEVAEKQGYSVRTIHRLHGDALQNLERICRQNISAK